MIQIFKNYSQRFYEIFTQYIPFKFILFIIRMDHNIVIMWNCNWHNNYKIILNSKKYQKCVFASSRRFRWSSNIASNKNENHTLPSLLKLNYCHELSTHDRTPIDNHLCPIETRNRAHFKWIVKKNSICRCHTYSKKSNHSFLIIRNIKRKQLKRFCSTQFPGKTNTGRWRVSAMVSNEYSKIVTVVSWTHSICFVWFPL